MHTGPVGLLRLLRDVRDEDVVVLGEVSVDDVSRREHRDALRRLVLRTQPHHLPARQVASATGQLVVKGKSSQVKTSVGEHSNAKSNGCKRWEANECLRALPGKRAERFGCVRKDCALPQHPVLLFEFRFQTTFLQVDQSELVTEKQKPACGTICLPDVAQEDDHFCTIHTGDYLKG